MRLGSIFSSIFNKENMGISQMLSYSFNNCCSWCAILCLVQKWPVLHLICLFFLRCLMTILLLCTTLDDGFSHHVIFPYCVVINPLCLTWTQQLSRAPQQTTAEVCFILISVFSASTASMPDSLSVVFQRESTHTFMTFWFVLTWLPVGLQMLWGVLRGTSI